MSAPLPTASGGDKGRRSKSMSTVPVNLYAPPQTSPYYPYPVASQTRTTKRFTSSQTMLSAGDLAATPHDYPTSSRRPPPLDLGTNLSRQTSHACSTSTTSTFSAIKVLGNLSRLNPFNRSRCNCYECLEEERQAKEEKSELSRLRRTIHQ
jgi:hypothetical protein